MDLSQDLRPVGTRTTPRSVSMKKGESGINITVAIIQDDIYEFPDEWFTIRLTKPTNGAIFEGQTTTLETNITILEDGDNIIAFNSSNYYEKENLNTTVVFKRLGSTEKATYCTLYVDETFSTATQDIDYKFATQTVNFAIGEKFTNITLNIVDDDNYKDEREDEFIILKVDQPCLSGTTPHETLNNARAYIVDDGDAGTISFTTSKMEFFENVGYATVTVTRLNKASGTVSVEYMTEDKTATSTKEGPGGRDYVPHSPNDNSIIFLDGELNHTFEVEILQDLAIEIPDETIDLKLTNLKNGLLPGPIMEAELVILDDGDASTTAEDDMLRQQLFGLCAEVSCQRAG